MPRNGRTYPRQWFFDEKNPGWVRNGSLVIDEMIRLTATMHQCRWSWLPRFRAMAREWDELVKEQTRIKFTAIRSDKLTDGDVQVDADLTRKLFPNNPNLWRKKD